MTSRLPILAFLVALLVSGCAHRGPMPGDYGPRATVLDGIASTWRTVANRTGLPGTAPLIDEGGPQAAYVESHPSWGEPVVTPAALDWPQQVADSDGDYLLDTGDRLRVFVYGQPNLSRIYTVDHAGKITVPLIGNVMARGRTTYRVAAAIRQKLGRDFVRDPQVTVDIQQARPFFILGEVRNAGQYPYVSGMTVEMAVAIAGGYTERASKRGFKVSRRINGVVEVVEASTDYVLQAGDTVVVRERFF